MWSENGWIDWTTQLGCNGFASSYISDDFTQDSITIAPQITQPRLSDETNSGRPQVPQSDISLSPKEEVIKQPTFIDVGLHPAALSPGSYREYVASRVRRKSKILKALNNTNDGSSTKPQKVTEPLNLTPTTKPSTSQFPITIPHAGGELVARPLKRRGDTEITVRPAKVSHLGVAKRIKLKVQESATKCSVEWTPLSDGSSNFKQFITISAMSKVVASAELREEINSFEFNTDPGQAYEINLVVKHETGEIVAEGRIECKAVFSLAEMDLLMCRALTCTGTRMQSFAYIYRCKPQVYWDDITYRRGGIMEKYIKDNNGQAASPVNAEIFGLFFSARSLLDGSMVTTSPFGNIRMKIPAMKLLDPEKVNFYFSDYYCNRLAHYVTVVVCECDSETDEYCQEKLVQLDPEDNPFLMVRKSENSDSPYTFFVNNKTWVEIYYTENVPMSFGTFEKIQATGTGSSSVGGLPQNKACVTCNLYPITSKSKRSLSDSTEQVSTEVSQITISPSLVRTINIPTFNRLNKSESEITSCDSSLVSEVTEVLNSLVNQVASADIYFRNSNK